MPFTSRKRKKNPISHLKRNLIYLCYIIEKHTNTIYIHVLRRVKMKLMLSYINGLHSENQRSAGLDDDTSRENKQKCDGDSERKIVKRGSVRGTYT